MCTFLSVVMENLIDSTLIDSYKSEGIIINNITEYILNRSYNRYYYMITNGHCSCDILDLGNYKRVLKTIFRCISNSNMMLILYDDDGTFDLSEHLDLLIKKSPKIELNFKEFLKDFPTNLVHNVTYCLSHEQFSPYGSENIKDLMAILKDTEPIENICPRWWLKIDKMTEQYKEYYECHGRYPSNEVKYLDIMKNNGYSVTVHSLLIEMVSLSNKIGFDKPISIVDFIALLTDTLTSFGDDKSKIEKVKLEKANIHKFIEEFKRKYYIGN